MAKDTPTPAKDLHLSILDGLTDAQKAFILAREPNRESQVITEADWAAIDPCIETGDEDWPLFIWWGGMRRNCKATPADDEITFMFNDLGLQIRTALLETEK